MVFQHWLIKADGALRDLYSTFVSGERGRLSALDL